MSTEQVDGGFQIAPLSITNAQISPTAAIDPSKLAAVGADQNMGGFSIINLGAGGAGNAAATVAQATGGASWAGTFGGVVNAYTASTSPSQTPFVGMLVAGIIPAGLTNTLAATLNVNGAGAAPIQNMQTALVAGLVGALCVHVFQWTGSAWEILNPMPVRGQNRQVASSTTITNSTSTTYATKVTLTATNLPAGTYGVFWQWQWRTGSGGKYRTQVDGVTVGPEHLPEGPDGTNWFTFHWYSEHTFTGAPATRTFRIQQAAEFSASQTSIREAHIYLERVA